MRHHEIPELIRVAAPVYVKFGLRNAPDVYPAGTHLEATTVALSRERVRRARLGLELLARSGYAPTTSELGAAGLAVPDPSHDEGELMARPVTLFTGQWADLPLDRPRRALRRLGLRRPRARLLGRPLRGRQGARRQRLRRGPPRAARAHGLGVWAIGAHLVGQAVCDRIDERHRAILPPEVYGDGEPEGVRHARRRADEGHRARRGAARRHAGQRLHRLVDLASASTRSRRTTSPRSSAATRTSPSAGGRSSTCSTPKACASGSRCTRPRSPTTS